MRIFFLGVGEACDSEHGNCSALVTTNGFSILLDCGFSVPHAYFRTCTDPEELDAVWISHFHGDHFLGLPLLLLRLWEMKRKRPLRLIGRQGIEETCRAALELAYPGFADKLSFPLAFLPIEPGRPLPLEEVHLQAVQTIHSEKNYGLLLSDNRYRLYYSGDGRPSQEVGKLIRGCDLVLHEAFTLHNSMPAHGSITSCLELKEKAEIRQLALVHLERTTRSLKRKEINALLAGHPGVVLPEEGDSILLA